MAERVGFEALNVDPCSGLHELVQVRETKHNWISVSADIIDLF
jgi:hypothetical protein